MNFTFTLPTSDDPFGQWLEDNSVCVSIRCALGRFEITVSWSIVHSYSDDRGEHRESWTVTKTHEDFQTAMRFAIEAAQAEQASR